MKALDEFLMVNALDEDDTKVEIAKEILAELKKKTLTHREAVTTLECVKALLEDSVI